MAYREPSHSHPPHKANQKNLHNLSRTHSRASNTSSHRTTTETENLSPEELQHLRRVEMIRKRQQEKWRQERRRRLIREHKVQFLAGSVLFVFLLILAFVLIPGMLSSSKSSKKQKEEAAQIVKAGLYEDKNGTKYQESDGSFCKNDWREVDGSKYYFNKDGYMTTGWLELDGKEYFFDENGKYDSTKHRPMVALTFDDGPGRFTDKLLDCLEENNAKATFFMLGENAEKYPDVIKRLYDSGMELGNHTYDHQMLPSLSSEQVTEEIGKTNSIIENAAGVPADSLRPPGGSFNESVQELAGMPIIKWSLDTKDWKTKSADTTYQKVIDNVQDGSVVLMHDIHEWSIEASLRLIPELVEKGYKLVTVQELAAAKGIELKDGEVYYYFGEGTQEVE